MHLHINADGANGLTSEEGLNLQYTNQQMAEKHGAKLLKDCLKLKWDASVFPFHRLIQIMSMPLWKAGETKAASFALPTKENPGIKCLIIKLVAITTRKLHATSP